MNQENISKEICVWCAAPVFPIIGKDITIIDPFLPSVKDQKDNLLVDGKTIFTVRDNTYIACCQKHAHLYIELPRPFCHYPKPHKCKLEPGKSCINQVECDCPGKHIFCSEAAKIAFYNLSPILIQEEDSVEELSSILDNLIPPMEDIGLILNGTSLLPPEPLINEYTTTQTKKKPTKQHLPAISFVEVCKTCKCGYKDFKKCVRCDQKNCNICHSLNKCSNCLIEGWGKWSARITGLSWASNIYFRSYTVNKYPKLCPHCLIEVKEFSYMLSPCGHLSCTPCANKLKIICGICSKNVNNSSPVFLRYWSTKEITI